MINLCTLGTGGALPLPERGLASLYVRMNGRGLLIDCGEATQTAIRRLGWGFRCIDAVFLTHYHGDHCTGLPGFLLSMAKTDRTEPLHLWGPPGLRRVVEGLCVVVPHLPYPLILHELPEEETCFELIGLTATAFPLVHSVPTLGLALHIERGGAFLPEEARRLGVPVSQWKRLQRGETVEGADGPVTPAQVTGPGRGGIRFVYATDTRPTPAIVQHGRDADLLILEGMYGPPEKLPQALKNKHMLFAEAAALAAEAGAKRLLLTHFSNAEEEPEADLPYARSVFPATDAACDLMTLTLRFPAQGEGT